MGDYNPRDETTRSTRSERDLPDDTPRIAPLKDLGDFQVAEGYPDPRGWSVVEAEGRTVGKVRDLIVDTSQLRTRYLAVRLDKDEIGAKHDRDVLLPVGAARLDDKDDRVLLSSLTRAQLTTLQLFDEGAITREYENSVLSRMPSHGATAGESDYYASTHFDDKQFFGARRARAEQELKHDVQDERSAMREDVTIERRPVRADQPRGTIDSESEIRIPLTEEQAAIDKRAALKDELAGKREMKSEEKNVEADRSRERTEPPDDQKRPRP